MTEKTGKRGRPKGPRAPQFTKKFVNKKLKEIVHEIKFYDLIMQALLIASGIQLAIAFSYTSGGYWGSVLPMIAASSKAAGIEACTWIFNKAISRARELNLPQWFLWVLLLLVMVISTRANLKYEHEKRLAEKPMAVYLQETAPNAKNVAKHLDLGEQVDSWLAGGIIPFLILGVSFARSLQSQSATIFESTETRRIDVRERARGYRSRKEKMIKKLSGRK